SHHSMRPFWSGTDNADDAGGVKIAMVLGSYDPAKVPVFDMKLRYCIEGFFFDYEEPSTEEILEALIQKEITTIRGLILP
ncbi:MAG TPA: hypothetical protein VJW95_05070, partial [Dissulfurispiraceae bacterium]|nr:hypothetical protein [Dissulfurispiraceae bacterium]